jgi:hypothetical protein
VESYCWRETEERVQLIRYFLFLPVSLAEDGDISSIPNTVVIISMADNSQRSRNILTHDKPVSHERDLSLSVREFLATVIYKTSANFI